MVSAYPKERSDESSIPAREYDGLTSRPGNSNLGFLTDCRHNVFDRRTSTLRILAAYEQKEN